MTDTDQSVYRGQCFCGAVEIEAKGAPFAMGYCHCKDCRHWSAGPVNGFTLWPKGAVKVTKGGGKVGMYKKTEQSHRKFCKKCGGHILTEHPGDNPFTDVYAAILPDLTFQPALHINCESMVIDVKDDLPRYKDLPEDFGGTGARI